MKLFKLVDQWIEKIAGYLLIISVIGMLTLSVGTIVLRWFDSAFLWSEPLTRHFVFFSAFLGGVIATGRKNHIGIDIIGKYFEAQNNELALKWIGRVVSLACFCILIWLIYACYKFTLVEAEYGKVVFLGIHSKYLVALSPIGFSLIAYRFFYLFLDSFVSEEEA